MSGEFIFPFDDPDRLFDAVVEVAILGLDMALDDRCLADVLVQLVMARKVGLGVCPRDLECLRGTYGAPFFFGDHREQVLDPNHPRSWNIFDRTFVDFDRHGSRDLRPDHARMQHARQPDVRCHLQRPEDFSG